MARKSVSRKTNKPYESHRVGSKVKGIGIIVSSVIVLLAFFGQILFSPKTALVKEIENVDLLMAIVRIIGSAIVFYVLYVLLTQFILFRGWDEGIVFVGGVIALICMFTIGVGLVLVVGNMIMAANISPASAFSLFSHLAIPFALLMGLFLLITQVFIFTERITSIQAMNSSTLLIGGILFLFMITIMLHAVFHVVQLLFDLDFWQTLTILVISALIPIILFYVLPMLQYRLTTER